MTVEAEFSSMCRERGVSALVVGIFHHGSAGNGLSDGFREIGWNVADINLFNYFIMARSLATRGINRVLEKLLANTFNADIVSAAAENHAKIAIFTKGSYVSGSTLRLLRERGVVTINYFTDFHFGYRDVVSSTFANYDYIVTTKSFQVEPLAEMIGRERVAFVHQGYDPAAHRRHSFGQAPNYEWDIAYSGTASPHKLKWLLEIAERFSDRKLIVVGEGWRKLAAGTRLTPFVLGRALTSDYFASVIERSRINLAVHFGPDTKMGWQDNVSTRTFEIPACGGFMLHIDNEEVRTLYDVPGEIDVFADVEDLCAKIRFYLDRPDLRAAMIKRAHDRAVPAYGMNMRAREIAALVGQRIGTTR